MDDVTVTTPGESTTRPEVPADEDPEFPVVDRQQTRELESSRTEIKDAQDVNDERLGEINDRLDVLNTRIDDIDEHEETDELTSSLEDERDRHTAEVKELSSERADRNAVANELNAALDDVDNLLSVNGQVIENEETLERLQERERQLVSELDQIPESRDISESPPTGVDGLIENQRESAENELKDVRQEQLAVSSELRELRDPRTDTLIDIAITQSDVALRQSALVADGLSPNNSDVYNASEAIGTVHLNPTNRATIERLAEQYDIPPQLLAGVVAAELDFDHSRSDFIQDGLGRAGIHGGQGVGAASVHEEALIHALEQLNGEVHGFEFNEQVLDKDYRSTFNGSAESAAIVLKHLVNEYGNGDNLSAQDMAQIWAGFRAGVKGVNELEGKYGFESVEDWRNGQARGTEAFDPQFSEGTNAHISEPLFAFFAEQYS